MCARNETLAIYTYSYTCPTLYHKKSLLALSAIGGKCCCTRLSSSPFAGVSQVCYSQPGCTGDTVTAPGSSARDCCAGTDDGQSYSDVNGVCFVSQCIGMYVCCAVLHV